MQQDVAQFAQKRGKDAALLGKQGLAVQPDIFILSCILGQTAVVAPRT